MLNVNLNLYRTFLVVADSKSLTDASNKLNISVPAISKSIKQLEDYLGTILFYRDNGMRLTAAGKDFYNHIDEAFSNIDLGEKILLQKNDIANGEIIIGCPSHITNFYLMDFIEKVTSDYPNLKVKIISGPKTNGLIELLNNHKIDFIIDSSKLNIDDKYYVVEKIKELSHILISKEPLKINNESELERFTYILPLEYTTTMKNLVDCFKKHNIEMKNIKQLDVTETRINAVKRNMGLGYVFKDAVKEELKNKELYKVEIPFKLPSATLNLIYLKGQLTKIDKEFIKHYLKTS